MAVEKIPKLRQAFRKNNVFHLSQCDEKHSSKQVASITYTLEKKLFVASFFLRFVCRLDFKRVKKACSVLWCELVCFAFIDKKRPIKYYL